jgi:hypothetical protein
MGGAWRDDSPSNIRAVHWWCNSEKGSTRMDEFAFGKFGRGGTDDELVKPLIVIQRV